MKIVQMVLIFNNHLSKRKALHGHGLGRHTPDEIYQFGIDDLAVIKNQLNHHDFLLDTEQPTSIDETGYAFIANILQAPFTSPIQTFTHNTRLL